MSRQMGPRANGNPVARGAGTAAAKGAGLILLAVVIGIVLLNVVDKDGDVDAGAPVPDAETETTTTVAGTEPTAPPDGEDAGPVQTPEELAVLVLNGGAPTGSAGTMRDALRNAGYLNTLPPGDWDVNQTGNTVLCRAGLEREAAALATAVGTGTTTAAFPEEAPTGSEDADCVVVVGAAAA
ncbi:MAG: LytR C-terminal domain-containing protein [Actinomycetota bacterium]